MRSRKGFRSPISRLALIGALAIVVGFEAAPLQAFIYFFPRRDPVTQVYHVTDDVTTTIPFDPSPTQNYHLVAVGFTSKPQANDPPFPGSQHTATVVNVVAGGVLAPPVVVYSGSVLNLNNMGQISRNLDIYETSQFKMFGGAVVGEVWAHDTSSVDIMGGDAGHNALTALDHSQLTVRGGTVYGVAAEGNSIVKVIGGSVIAGVGTGESGLMTVDGVDMGTSVAARNTSSLSMNSCSIGGVVRVYDEARVSLSDVSIGDSLFAYGHASVGMSGRVVHGDLLTYDNSTVYVGSGVVEGVTEAHGSSVIGLFGGVFHGSLPGGFAPAAAPDASPTLGLTAFDSATIDIYGTQLAATLVDANYQGMFSEYELTGTLADGSAISTLMNIQNSTGASFALLPPPVPEPASAGWVITAVTSVLMRLSRRPSHPASASA